MVSILTLALSVTLQKPVANFSASAQTLDRLLPQIGQSIGQKLVAGPFVGNEVLLVNVKDVSTDVLLAKLASTVGGQWVKTSDGMRLDKDPNLEIKETQEALAERVEFLKAEIAKLVADNAKNPQFDPAKLEKQMQDQMQQFQQGGAQQGQQQQQGGPGGPGGRGMQMFGQMQQSMPGGRAVIQTLQTINVNELAKVAPGQRIVFSSIPTMMQKPMGGNPANIMRTFMADQTKLTSTIQQRFGNGGPGRGGRQNDGQEAPAVPQPPRANAQQTRQGQQGNQNQGSTQAQLVPYKSFLIVTRNGMGAGLMLNYMVADVSGQVIGSGNLFLGQGVPMQMNAITNNADKDSGIKLSETGKAAVALYSRANLGGRGMMGGGRGGFGGGPQGGQNAAPISADLSKKLADPVTNEPLSFYVEDVVKNMSGDKNVIAVLPDSLAGSVGRFVETGKSASTLQDVAKSDWNLEIKEEDGVLTVAPKRRFESRNQRVDRAALKTLLESISKKGAARLDDIAGYSTKAPLYGNGGLDSVAVRAVDPSAMQAFGDVYGEDRDMLMLWATMGSATRATLSQGRTLQIISAGNSGLKLLSSLTYNSNDGPRVVQQQVVQNGGAQPASAPGQRQQGRNGRGPGGFGGGNMAMERTEILPKGVPSATLLSMTVETTSVAKGVTKDAGISRIFSPEMMAGEKAFSEMPAPQNGNNQGRPQMPTISWQGYVPGKRFSYTFVFNYGNNLMMTRTLEDTSFDANTKAVALDSLPSDFRDAYNDRYKEMKDRMANGGGPGGRGQRGNGQGRGRRGQNGQAPPPLN